jgi:hypothetical protein
MRRQSEDLELAEELEQAENLKQAEDLNQAEDLEQIDVLERIKQKEQQLKQMESSLHNYYYEAGKTILEAAEAELARINVLVDQIVEMRIDIAEISRQSEGVCTNYKSPQLGEIK